MAGYKVFPMAGGNVFPMAGTLFHISGNFVSHGVKPPMAYEIGGKNVSNAVVMGDMESCA